jgi:hypothetical protein
MIDQYSGSCTSTAGARQHQPSYFYATFKLIQNFSIPEVIYFYGDPQFIKEGDFHKFFHEWGIRHIQSSPYMQ